MNLFWLVWLEEDPKAAPEITLAAASRRYTEKFGQAPNRALVPLGWPQEAPSNGLLVERRRHILPRHVHVAFDDTLQQEA